MQRGSSRAAPCAAPRACRSLCTPSHLPACLPPSHPQCSYLAKAWRFPRKVFKEWLCPLRSNAFVIPPATLVLIAFCTTGRFDGAATLAKVLYWIGAPATLALSLLLAARWVTEAHSAEHLNPAWLLPPTACYVCALVAPSLDSNYVEAGYLWFAFATAMALPLYVLTFQRALFFNDPDDRARCVNGGGAAGGAAGLQGLNPKKIGCEAGWQGGAASSAGAGAEVARRLWPATRAAQLAAPDRRARAGT